MCSSDLRFLSAIQGILRKRVCRCIVLLLFLYPAVAIQVFPLESVCRCMEPRKERRFLSATQGILQKSVCRCTESQKERRFLSAIQVISRKMVYRCTDPLHETSALSLCAELRHGTATLNSGTGWKESCVLLFAVGGSVFGIVFERCSLDELDERTYEA